MPTILIAVNVIFVGFGVGGEFCAITPAVIVKGVDDVIIPCEFIGIFPLRGVSL